MLKKLILLLTLAELDIHMFIIMRSISFTCQSLHKAIGIG